MALSSGFGLDEENARIRALDRMILFRNTNEEAVVRSVTRSFNIVYAGLDMLR
jgi:hypothetical protein